MGVVSGNWFDRVLLSILYVETLMLTDAQTPFLGTPLVPLKLACRAKLLERTVTGVYAPTDSREYATLPPLKVMISNNILGNTQT